MDWALLGAPGLMFNLRDFRRVMKQLGLKVEDLEADRVIVELRDGSKLVFEGSQAALVRGRGIPTILYVMGEPTRVPPEKVAEEEGVTITEEDVRLVAEQAGVSLEEARRALIEAKGDIAEAILRLKEGR